MTTGEVGAQPRKNTFLPQRAGENEHLAETTLLSKEHFRQSTKQHQAVLGLRMGCPQLGLAWHSTHPLSCQPPPDPTQGEDWGSHRLPSSSCCMSLPSAKHQIEMNRAKC